MDRPVIPNGNTDKDNFRNTSETIRDHLKPLDTNEHELATLNTDIEIRSSDTRPKDPIDNDNSDGENLIKPRETVDGTDVSNDVTDRPARKPSTYAAKKTAAQGLIDLALLMSNANQLKNLIIYQSRENKIYFFIVLFLILLSLVLQVSIN